MAKIECSDSNSSPVWGWLDLARWKLVPERLGGGWAFVRRFKDSWIAHNRTQILAAAQVHGIPAELLAAVAWIEVGGDPSSIDRIALAVRSFDWSGPEWVDRNLTITRPPDRTSFGAVSMQLRTAIQTMGLDTNSVSEDELYQIASCLERDVYNLQLVAKHLRQLVLVDSPKSEAGARLTDDQIRLAGTRYNRGSAISQEEASKNSSYGDVVLRIWARMSALLQEP